MPHNAFEPTHRRLTATPATLITCGLLSSLLFLAACSPPSIAPPPTRAVKVLQLAPQTIDGVGEFAAEVRARVESRLSFRVAGKITARNVELGQAVRAGQVLALLDPQDYKLGADAAQATMNTARANLELAQADLKRFKDLFDQNFISRAELDRREATFKVAQAQFDQATASAAVQANQAQYTRLVADVAGVVTSVDAQPGQVVAAGTPVLTIAQAGSRDAVFSVPEDQVQTFRRIVGTPVKVRLWGQGSELLTARIREVAQAADPSTRTYQVKADLGQADVTVGQSGTVLLPGAVAGQGAAGALALKVPMAAVFEQGGRSRVWVLDTKVSVVKAAEVKVVGADGGDLVLAAGLQPGQTIVVAGTHVLSEGQKVVVYTPPKGAAK